MVFTALTNRLDFEWYWRCNVILSIFIILIINNYQNWETFDDDLLVDRLGVPVQHVLDQVGKTKLGAKKIKYLNVRKVN